MLPFGVTIPATAPQGSEIPEGLMNNPVFTSVASLAVPYFSTLSDKLQDFRKKIIEN
jgi:hypothetical protein